MKRILLLLFAMLFTMTMAAQSKHLKFMGIPLDGTISQFQFQLIEKGCTPDEELNRNLPVGSKAFDGFFAGEQARIFVYYDETTEIVYRVKVFHSYPESIAEEKFSSVERMLKKKYEGCYMEESEQDGHRFLRILTDSRIGSGVIYLHLSQEISNSPDNHYIHTDYTDIVNLRKHESPQMDNL